MFSDNRKPMFGGQARPHRATIKFESFRASGAFMRSPLIAAADQEGCTVQVFSIKCEANIFNALVMQHNGKEDKS